MALPALSTPGSCNGRWFINGVGAGLDARVAKAAARVRRMHGPLTYAIGLLRVLRDHRQPPHATIAHDAGTYCGAVTLAAIMNGRVLGALFPIAPDADPTDGRLDLVIGGDLSRRRIAALLPALMLGQHRGRPGIAYIATQHVRVRAEEPLPVQIDGEVLPEPLREFEVTILPGAVQILV